MAKKGKAENLIGHPTTEEARLRGKKGGIASGKARQEKKTLRQCAEIIGSMMATSRIKDKMKEFGIEESDATNDMAVLMSLTLKAIKGDVKATETLIKLRGEMVEKTEITGNDGQPFFFPKMTEDELKLLNELNK